MIDEGYIKYQCEWINADILASSDVAQLTQYRDALHQLNLIGEYPGGIGFGNISRRLSPPLPERLPAQTIPAQLAPTTDTPKFIISGTQTGSLPTLSAADYSLVTTFDPAQNTLTCEGLRKASSESLTHGVIYAAHPAIGAIIHVHHPQLWKRLLHQIPTTRVDVPYGTPEMATETQRLFAESSLLQQRIFAMAGHEDGVVTFGENLQMAYRVLVNWGVRVGILSDAALQLPYQ